MGCSTGWCSITCVFPEQSRCGGWSRVIGACRDGTTWFVNLLCHIFYFFQLSSSIWDQLLSWSRTPQLLQVPWWWYPNHPGICSVCTSGHKRWNWKASYIEAYGCCRWVHTWPCSCAWQGFLDAYWRCFLNPSILISYSWRSFVFKKKSVLIVFYILKGRGTVATGRIEQGVIKVGEEVEILGLKDVSVPLLSQSGDWLLKATVTYKHVLDLIFRDLQWNLL